MKVYIVRLIDKGVKLETVYRVQKITIAPLKKGLSLNFTLWNIESAAIPILKTIVPTQKLYQSGHAIWLAYHNLIQCTQA